MWRTRGDAVGSRSRVPREWTEKEEEKGRTGGGFGKSRARGSGGGRGLCCPWDPWGMGSIPRPRDPGRTRRGRDVPSGRSDAFPPARGGSQEHVFTSRFSPPPTRGWGNGVRVDQGGETPGLGFDDDSWSTLPGRKEGKWE